GPPPPAAEEEADPFSPAWSLVPPQPAAEHGASARVSSAASAGTDPVAPAGGGAAGAGRNRSSVDALFALLSRADRSRAPSAFAPEGLSAEELLAFVDAADLRER